MPAGLADGAGLRAETAVSIAAQALEWRRDRSAVDTQRPSTTQPGRATTAATAKREPRWGRAAMSNHGLGGAAGANPDGEAAQGAAGSVRATRCLGT